MRLPATLSLPDCIRASISAMPTSVEYPSRLRLAVVSKKVHVDAQEPVIWKLPAVTAREGALEVPIDPKAIADAFKAKLAAVHTEQSRLPVTEQELFIDAEKKARSHERVAPQAEEVIMNSNVIKIEEFLPEPG